MAHYAIQTFYSLLKIQLVKKLCPLYTFMHQLFSQPQEYPVGRSLHNHSVSLFLPSFAVSDVSNFKAEIFLKGQDREWTWFKDTQLQQSRSQENSIKCQEKPEKTLRNNFCNTSCFMPCVYKRNNLISSNSIIFHKFNLVSKKYCINSENFLSYGFIFSWILHCYLKLWRQHCPSKNIILNYGLY